MNMIKRLFISIAILIIVSFFTITHVEATEGLAELKNVNGSDAKCFAMSTLINRATSYRILLQCRNLLYPIEKDGEFYILWAFTEGENPSPKRMGDIGLGKVTFTTRNAFSRLFITKEQTQSPRQPSENTVMEGVINPISFLRIEPTPKTTVKTPAKKPTPNLTQKPSATPTPAQQSLAGTIFSVIRTIFTVIIVIVIFAIVIFIVYRIIKSRSE